MKEKDIGKELITLNHAIKKRAERELQGDLMKISMANGYIMSFLAENRERDIFQKDFEDVLGITRSTASKILSLMEEKGLIERTTVRGDARLKKIVLTPVGDQMLRNMSEAKKNMEKQLRKGFSQEEITRLCDYLNRMRDNMKE